VRGSAGEPSDRAARPAHPPAARLGILTVTADTKRIDFVSLRDLLGLTDGNLSRHLSTLETAGYVKVDKTFDDRKPRTWIAITRNGRRALAAELAALRDIVGDAAPAPRLSPDAA
jgi:DNA-binding MarR family transcriptional regulator